MEHYLTDPKMEKWYKDWQPKIKLIKIGRLDLGVEDLW